MLVSRVLLPASVRTRWLLLKPGSRWKSNSTSNMTIKQLMGKDVTDKKPVKVQGWVRSIRSHPDHVFLHINDGSCLGHLQVLSTNLLFPSAATYGSCVEVEGYIQPSIGKGQKVEVLADTISVLGECDPVAFPFKAKKHHPSDYVRSFQHLRPRTNTFGSLLRLRNAASKAIHDFFQESDFIQVHTPIITTNDCEGAGEIFQVDSSSVAREKATSKGEEDLKNFFNSPAYLTVSGQLHLEVINGALSKVYTFGPTFRAENSRSRHHLSEFYMVEAEMAFINSVEDINRVVEDLIKYVTIKLVEEHSEDVNFFVKNIAPKNHQETIDKIITSTYIRLPYTEAINILEKQNQQFQTKVEWGCDLQKEHERYLVTQLGNIPVFVTDFPTSIKPFYSRVNENPQTVASVDLLAPGVGEICGGTLREERLPLLEERLNSEGLVDSYQWYLDLRRFGSAPHGGFGIGFERYIQAVLGISNIKDAIPFPRSTHSCKM